MIYVHLCSPTNSTIFTNCCKVAINDNQIRCPACKEEVYPGEGSDHHRSRLRWTYAYGRQKRNAAPTY